MFPMKKAAPFPPKKGAAPAGGKGKLCPGCKNPGCKKAGKCMKGK